MKKLYFKVIDLILTVLICYLIIYFMAKYLFNFFCLNNFPNFMRIIEAFKELSFHNSLYKDLLSTFTRILIGGSVGEIFSIFFSLLAVKLKAFGKVLKGIVGIFAHAPIIALIPLVILITPDTESSILLIISISSFLGTFDYNISIIRKISSWNKYYIALFYKRNIISDFVVSIPYFLHYLPTSISYSFSSSWTTVVTAEVLSGTTGVGFRLWQSFSILDFPQMIVYLIIIIGCGEIGRAFIDSIGYLVKKLKNV
ncbi:hypothetical protein [Lactobacillus melliventris]|uniref:ABC transporter permease n=1 Tax=Lactobacillus melliventris TaxID=1218507 RepID=A0A0F4LFI1_9LACO|nr:hypothetical protein [Lactobacillus melliventris]KJY57375.1 hypothetical protein JF74_03980 [Lactobacillus melliventris]PXY83981.1 hypothetical protein DK873_02005 [Lactobacillus melliventris]